MQIWSIWSTFDFLLKIFIKRRNFTHFIHYISRSKFKTKKCLIAIKSKPIYTIWVDLNAKRNKTSFLNRPVGGISISCERQQYYLLFISYLKPNSYKTWIILYKNYILWSGTIQSKLRESKKTYTWLIHFRAMIPQINTH